MELATVMIEIHAPLDPLVSLVTQERTVSPADLVKMVPTVFLATPHKSQQVLMVDVESARTVQEDNLDPLAIPELLETEETTEAQATTVTLADPDPMDPPDPLETPDLPASQESPARQADQEPVEPKDSLGSLVDPERMVALETEEMQADLEKTADLDLKDPLAHLATLAQLDRPVHPVSQVKLDAQDRTANTVLAHDVLDSSNFPLQIFHATLLTICFTTFSPSA